MNLYIADAGSDWGITFSNRQIKASTMSAAIGQAGRMAVKEGKKRAKMVHVKVRFVGNEERITKNAAETQ